MFVISSGLVKTVMNKIRSTVQFLDHIRRRSSSRVHELPNSAMVGIRVDRAMDENNLTFFIDTRVPIT